MLKIYFNPKVKIINEVFFYYLFSTVLLIFSVFFWDSIDINVYLSLTIALIVITADYSKFKKYLIYLTYLIFVLALYEYLTRSYIFVVMRETPWGELPLDEKLFGGLAGVFRAKALFEGPLALAQFAIGISLIFRKNFTLILLCILLSVFANGRLALLVTSSVLILYIIEKYSLVKFLKSKKIIYGVVISLISIPLFVTYFLNKTGVDRIIDAFSFNDSSNNARFYYWGRALETFLNYDPIHIVFGNSGYLRTVLGNSAENGWLMLLLDNGILGFLYYSIPVAVIAILSYESKRIYYGHMFLLFVCMFIQTFHMGALAGLFYWIIVYSFLHELLKSKKEYR
jgi:hypothetical protein